MLIVDGYGLFKPLAVSIAHVIHDTSCFASAYVSRPNACGCAAAME
jgi:hypothetical protein